MGIPLSITVSTGLAALASNGRKFVSAARSNIGTNTSKSTQSSSCAPEVLRCVCLLLPEGFALHYGCPVTGVASSHPTLGVGTRAAGQVLKLCYGEILIRVLYCIYGGVLLRPSALAHIFVFAFLYVIFLKIEFRHVLPTWLRALARQIQPTPAIQHCTLCALPAGAH